MRNPGGGITEIMLCVDTTLGRGGTIGCYAVITRQQLQAAYDYILAGIRCGSK